jgi:chromosome segregation ATPase
VSEREHQGKLEELQAKLERLLKETEREAKEYLDARMKESDARHQSELERLNDQVSKLENENFKKSQTIKLQEIEKHQVDLRLVELAEAIKTEKIAAEKHIETLNREKELDIIKITEDLSQLKTELSRAENVNLDLLQEVRDLKQLRDKYEDLKAEWLTLKQTNTEFKRTLGDKVKETMRMQRENELFR